ncbi:MAG: class I SAM-dependent methyltransferase, partial [Anaerolineae bacterium]|nr:class I SAM-dependent methyltransferase [Anaerolineae bacterium]
MSLRYFEITEGGNRILNPLDEQHLLFIGDLCDLKPGMRQLDLACGEGEMLCRFADRYGTSGVGVDISTVFLGNARKRADELGVADRVTFVQGDGAKYADLVPDTRGAFDVVSCIGATWIGGGTLGTLNLMRPALNDNPDALVLVGEVFWQNEPDAEAAAAMGFASPDDVPTRSGLLERFDAAGLELLEMVAATTEMWDRY